MTSSIKRAARVLGWALLLPGMFMGYQGCSRASGGLATWLGGDAAEGTVTDIRSYAGSPSPASTRYREASVITFTTASGEVVTFEHPVQSAPPPFEMGEHVRVFYDPAAPQHAVAPSGLAMLVFGWGFVATAGLVLVLSGIAVLLIGKLPWMARRSTGD